MNAVFEVVRLAIDFARATNDANSGHLTEEQLLVEHDAINARIAELRAGSRTANLLLEIQRGVVGVGPGVRMLVAVVIVGAVWRALG